MKLNNIKYVALSIGAVLTMASCNIDDDGPEFIEPMLDFSGTYSQVDHLGRPGINTVLSYDMDGQPSVKDAQNVSIPSEMAGKFQAGFEARLEQYHDVYAGILGLDPNDVNYETNIAGLDASTLTGYLAADVLEVAPNNPTTYFAGLELALTGRALTDDVIDVSLILLFGGETGDRFNGQPITINGEMKNLPRLVSDGVSLTATLSSSFPYVGSPE
ncbi:DUF4331 domain-containing protein [Cellulophaga sp. F20128]|uniref:DUF4331 domain-containing protein n=1 Tax=Cellulophaga sp. F20128 TaxID=2926413 RepID=UPI001FF67CDA|nr:DUF4331 domain-containing protein [Cellulophaga sp. F20128]MCK0156979.1 DUF4331 domain-containing protein [Cellulophaga sp. F20128]